MKHTKLNRYIVVLTISIVGIISLSLFVKGYSNRMPANLKPATLNQITKPTAVLSTVTLTTWKTYVDVPTQLSFKYPAPFDMKENKFVESLDFPTKVYSFDFFDGRTMFNVAEYKNIYNYSLDSIPNSVFLKYTSTPLADRKLRKIMLGNKQAIILESLKVNEHIQTPIYLSSPFTDVFIIRNNYIYRFELSKDNIAESKNTFNQILNTIEFVSK